MPGTSRASAVSRPLAAGVSSPALGHEGTASRTRQRPAPLPPPQMVYAVTGSMPTVGQDSQGPPPSAGDSAPPDSAYDPGRALHRQYTDLGRRESSFLRWPDTHDQTPEELAVAGFFYTGK